VEPVFCTRVCTVPTGHMLSLSKTECWKRRMLLQPHQLRNLKKKLFKEKQKTEA